MSETTGHTWQLDDYTGKRDDWAFTAGEYHNGPECIVCGAAFCEHCEPERLDEECPGADGVPAEAKIGYASMALAFATAYRQDRGL